MSKPKSGFQKVLEELRDEGWYNIIVHGIDYRNEITCLAITTDFKDGFNLTDLKEELGDTFHVPIGRLGSSSKTIFWPDIVFVDDAKGNVVFKKLTPEQEDALELALNEDTGKKIKAHEELCSEHRPKIIDPCDQDGNVIANLIGKFEDKPKP